MKKNSPDRTDLILVPISHLWYSCMTPVMKHWWSHTQPSQTCLTLWTTLQKKFLTLVWRQPRLLLFLIPVAWTEINSHSPSQKWLGPVFIAAWRLWGLNITSKAQSSQSFSSLILAGGQISAENPWQDWCRDADSRKVVSLSVLPKC